MGSLCTGFMQQKRLFKPGLFFCHTIQELCTKGRSQKDPRIALHPVAAQKKANLLGRKRTGAGRRSSVTDSSKRSIFLYFVLVALCGLIPVSGGPDH
jgi:hypothetical protein